VLAEATHALQARPDAAARDVHAAKAFIGQQARLLAQDAVQLHGGIGITDEYAVSHCLRRVIVDALLKAGASALVKSPAVVPAEPPAVAKAS